MPIPEKRWDDELAYEVLRRHSYEDLHAGIYESYRISMAGIRKHIKRMNPSVIDVTLDARLVAAMYDERPLVPVYGYRPSLNESVNIPKLELQRIHPETGVILPDSAVAAAYVDPVKAAVLTPSTYFNSEQIQILLEHHEELMESGLVPRVPTQ